MNKLRSLKSSIAQTVRDDRGFVLILALVAMLSMTVIGVSLISNMTTEMQIARNEREAKAAFNLAEAAINEGMARLRLSISDANYAGEPLAAEMCAAGFPCPRYTATWGGTPLINCADGLACTVSVKYLVEAPPFCDSAANAGAPNTIGGLPAAINCNNEVVMYGQDFNISDMLTSNKIGKFPVYEITGIGTYNNTTRTVVAYVGGSSMNTDTGAALNTNNCLDPSGAATPNVFADSGFSTNIIENDSCPLHDPLVSTHLPASQRFDPNTFLTGSGNMSDLISIADEVHYCVGTTCNAAGDDIPSSGSVDTLVTNWGDYAGDTYSSIIYLTCIGKPCSISGNFQGRGLLIVQGDLTLSGNFSYEGLIFVSQHLTLSGGGSTMNVTGGIMSNGTTTSHGSNLTVTYSPSTLMDVGRSSSSKAMIGWKRL